MTRPPPAPATSAAVAAPPIDSVTAESDFVIILAALLCALICMVGLIAVVRCTCLRRSADRGSPSSASSAAASRNANKGVKKKVLQTLPVFTFTSSSSASTSGPVSKFAAECSICLTEFAEGDEVRVLPQCGHGFHVACIDMWLGSHSSCPSCRQVLVVGRCQKCGGFPVAHGGPSAAGAAAEVELKQREDSESGNRNSENFLP